MRSWAGVTGIWASQVSQWVENLPGDLIPESEDPLEKEMATPSNILAWRIPWADEPDGPQTTGSQSVVHGRAAEHACTLGSVSSRAACYAVMCTDRAALRLCEAFYLILIVLLCREFYHCPPSQIRHPRQGPVARAAAEGAGEDSCRPLPSFHTCVLSAHPHNRLYSPRSELAQPLRLVDPAPGQALMLGSPGPRCRPPRHTALSPRAPPSLLGG